MKNRAEIIWGATIALGISTVMVTTITAGCAGSKASESTASAAPATLASDDGKPDGTDGSGMLEFSGAQLWDQNCAQCHNNRNPKDYSDAQWDVAVMHMRIQARLTGEEERKIAQFLKASN